MKTRILITLLLASLFALAVPSVGGAESGDAILENKWTTTSVFDTPNGGHIAAPVNSDGINYVRAGQTVYYAFTHQLPAGDEWHRYYSLQWDDLVDSADQCYPMTGNGLQVSDFGTCPNCYRNFSQDDNGAGAAGDGSSPVTCVSSPLYIEASGAILCAMLVPQGSAPGLTDFPGIFPYLCADSSCSAKTSVLKAATGWLSSAVEGQYICSTVLGPETLGTPKFSSAGGQTFYMVLGDTFGGDPGTAAWTSILRVTGLPDK